MGKGVVEMNLFVGHVERFCDCRDEVLLRGLVVAGEVGDEPGKTGSCIIGHDTSKSDATGAGSTGRPVKCMDLAMGYALSRERLLWTRGGSS